jgi:hypothetical protein
MRWSCCGRWLAVEREFTTSRAKNARETSLPLQTETHGCVIRSCYADAALIAALFRWCRNVGETPCTSRAGSPGTSQSGHFGDA